MEGERPVMTSQQLRGCRREEWLEKTERSKIDRMG